MKWMLFVPAALLTFSTATAQKDSTAPTPKEYGGWKDGNNTFRCTIAVLQTYVSRPHTLEQFQQTLGHYEQRWYEADTVSYANGDSLDMIMPYALMIGKEEPYIVDVHYNKRHRVTGIHYVLEERHIDVDAFGRLVNQLKAAGYQYNLGYTRLYSTLSGSHRKAFLKNPVNKVTVSIYAIDEYSYAIDVTK